MKCFEPKMRNTKMEGLWTKRWFSTPAFREEKKKKNEGKKTKTQYVYNTDNYTALWKLKFTTT